MGKNQAIVSLVLAVVGLVGVWIPYVCLLSPFCAIAGIIVAAVALSKIKKSGQTSGGAKGMAIAGLVISIIGTVENLAFYGCVICTVCFVGQALSQAGIDWSQFGNIQDFMEAIKNLPTA